MKKKHFLNAAIWLRLSAGFAVLLTAVIFTFAGCGDTAGGSADADLSGSVTIIPNASVTTGVTLTAYYYGGTETIANYQWKRGNTNVGTNSNTYTPDQAGNYYVTISAAGYKSKTSTAVAVTASSNNLDNLSGNVTISPAFNVVVNTTLTAAYSGGSEAVTYQWKRDSTDVGTGSTYTPDQAGLYTVTVSADGYKSKTSAAVYVTAAAGNSDPKSLYIIGITENYIVQAADEVISLVFPAGTALNNVKADLTALYSESGSPEHATAGVNFKSGPVKVGTTYAVTGDLYASENTRWTGSGTVDVYSFLSDRTKGYLYKVPNLLIQSAVTTVSLFDLEVAFLEEMALPEVPSISGTVTLTDIPTNPAPRRLEVEVSGYKAGVTVDSYDSWYSYGGYGVDFSKGHTNLTWRIRISDLVWDDDDPTNAGRTDFFPADLNFGVYVSFYGDDSRNYWVDIPSPPKHFNSEEEAVNINLGTVSLKNTTP